MTEQEKKVKFEEYLDDFDPTPQYLYDNWDSPMDFDDFCIYLEEEEFEKTNVWDGSNPCICSQNPHSF